MKFDLEHLKNSMIAQSQRNEIVANNLANLKSSGFKRDVVFFEALTAAQRPDFEMQVETDFQQGQLTQTDNPLDFAITGPGFFELDTPEGPRYTRDGHFRFNDAGVLINNDGYAVVGSDGAIFLPPDAIGSGVLRVTEDGQLFVGDLSIAGFSLANIENPQTLLKAGKNSFAAAADTIIHQDVDSKVHQGFIEDANVNPVEEMVELIEIQRQFESMQRMVQTLDSTFKTAAEQVGRYQ